ncbi:MAG: nickel pincer cofactor biosynthesis protein LarC [Fibrobacteres bacterium]|nr:nickel pincer cofactor biosynthesis protein LarC [Fibrobacterota bacterium]
MKSILFDMQSGVAGDMVCAALLDLGLSWEEFQSMIKTLPLTFDICVSKVRRSGISANHFSVTYPEQHYHRHLEDILEIISKGKLPETAKKRAEAIFQRLAAAEAKVHGTTVDKVHFHEVGAVDSIVDIVGAALLTEMAEAKSFYSTPFIHGFGSVKTEHGVMGVPAPATVELTLKYRSRRVELEGELTTPTGAAIVTALTNENSVLPAHTVLSAGYGAGTKEFKGFPNVMRVVLLDSDNVSSSDTVTLIQSNIDDASPEIIGRTMERLFEEGALDVFSTSILMKKNRPAVMVSVIAEKSKCDKLSSVLMAESGSIGVRFTEWNRFCLEREASEVNTKWGSVKVKVIKTADGARVTPEYESCKELSGKIGVPVRVIYEEVIRSRHFGYAQ